MESGSAYVCHLSRRDVRPRFNLQVVTLQSCRLISDVLLRRAIKAELVLACPAGPWSGEAAHTSRAAKLLRLLTAAFTVRT